MVSTRFLCLLLVVGSRLDGCRRADKRRCQFPMRRRLMRLATICLCSPARRGWFSLSCAGIRLFFVDMERRRRGRTWFRQKIPVVRLCSLTKIFTTDVLTKLIADKTVRLDDPLQRFAPAHTIVPKRERPITLLDLATHTSGLPRELGRLLDRWHTSSIRTIATASALASESTSAQRSGHGGSVFEHCV